MSPTTASARPSVCAEAQGRWRFGQLTVCPTEAHPGQALRACCGPGACRWEMPGRGDRNGPASARGQRPDGLSARVTGRAGHIAQETAGGRRTGGGRGRGGFRRGAGLSLSAFGFLPVLPAGPPRRGAGRGFPPRPLTSAPGARNSDRASVSLTGMCADSTQD